LNREGDIGARDDVGLGIVANRQVVALVQADLDAIERALRDVAAEVDGLDGKDILTNGYAS
jgi:hypothetical protein